MKEFLSGMDIIINLSTQEILRQKKWQMGFLEKLILKKNLGHKLTINAFTCSILESPSTSAYYDMDNGVSK